MKKVLITIVMVLFASSLCLAEEKVITPVPETAKAAPAVAQKPAVKAEKKATKGVKPKAKKAKSVPAAAAVKK